MKQVRKYVAFGFIMLALSAFVPCTHAETIDSYGSEFVAISNNRPGEGCVITALFEPTEVTLSNGQQFVLHRGETLSVSEDQWTSPDGTRTRTLYISASEPVRVEHTTSFGEKFVRTLLPSLSCESARELHYTFAQKTVKASLFLIVPANQLSGFTLDGKVLKFKDSYAVTGNDEWVYEVIDLGTRKAGSTLTLVGPTDRYYAAVVGHTYDFLNECALEASVSIDTIHADPQFALHTGPMMANSYAVSQQQNTGQFGAMEESDEEGEEWENIENWKDEEKEPSYHRGVLYLQGAYAAMPLKMAGYNTSMGLGYGAAAGGMYEFQIKSFLMQTGAGFYWLDRRVNILDQPAPNRYDRAISGGIEVPLMFGQNFAPVYYLLGVKLGFDLMSMKKSACSPLAASPASSAPVSQEQISRVKPEILRESGLLYGLNFDPRISAEFGFNLGQERNEWVHSRLAFFADWGFYPSNLARIVLPDDTHPVSTTVGDPDDYATYQLTHFMYLHESYGSAGCFLHHFQVGLKFTLVLGN